MKPPPPQPLQNQIRRDQICFIAYLDQDNLGVGYMASCLLQTGSFAVTIVDVKEDSSIIIRSIIEAKPLIVGFSIAFQMQMDMFRRLMTDLRENGVNCHFTAGGHYPSLRYEEVMNLAPELDSVVLFEGEHTIVELAEAIRARHAWQDITGVAYRENTRVRRNALRPLENDLDRFPPPVRRTIRPRILDRKVVNMLASRGCYYQCSFCSIRRFYSQAKGQVKRVRRPDYVVREMQLYYEQEGCSIFLFQDDDFPIGSAHGPEWINDFCFYLRSRNLHTRVMWKMSCRANEIDKASMSRLMDHGLGMVYLGIESGTLEGLKSMNKRITPDDSLSAKAILKQLQLPFEFGFMMFDPSTTLDSIRKNIGFLTQLCGDGTASVGLAKMLALAGTDIEESLRREGRLFGQAPYEDYLFLDPIVDKCYAVLSDIFRGWMHDELGIMNYSRWVHLQIEAFRRFSMRADDARRAVQNLNDIVASANQCLLRAVMTVVDLAQSPMQNHDAFNKFHSEVSRRQNELYVQLKTLANHVDAMAGIR